MRKGEKLIIGLMAASVALLVVVKVINKEDVTEEDPGIPFYSTASQEVTSAASRIIRHNKCKECHSLWATRDMTISVPAPALDGMGMFRDEEWLYNYFSAENPQKMLETRLKPQYRMPSFSYLSEQERRNLANYIASLKVEDWYLEETKKARYEKLTGKDYD